MGIIQTTTWRAFAPGDSTHAAVVDAMNTAGINITSAQNPIVGSLPRAIRKNRWAAELSATVRPESEATSFVEWSIDMVGDKHFEILDEIAEQLKDLRLDDLGITDAVERLGKMGRTFGWREIRGLARVMNVNERAIELAQGVYDGQQGLLVLTDRRMFFYNQKMFGSKIDEFDLTAVQSLGQAKKMGGEIISISISGRSAEIKQVAHGRSDVFIRAFREAKSRVSAAGPPATATQAAPQDHMEALHKLAELHRAGILTDEEFAAKKAEILSRI